VGLHTHERLEWGLWGPWWLSALPLQRQLSNGSSERSDVFEYYKSLLYGVFLILNWRFSFFSWYFEGFWRARVDLLMCLEPVYQVGYFAAVLLVMVVIFLLGFILDFI